MLDADEMKMLNEQNNNVSFNFFNNRKKILIKELQQFLQDKAVLQEQRKRSIDDEVKELQNRKKEAKTHSLEIDRYLLNLDRNKVDEQKNLKFERKKQEETEGKSNLLLQELRNQREFNEKQRDQKEYNDLLKRNVYKEIQKEANYKNVL